MSIQTSTGVKIYISTQLPATFNLAGYGALTWTEIKEVTNIVPPSPSYQVVTHEPLKSGITQKNKGFVDYGDPTIDYALDTSDTGQQMLQSAASGATKNLEHSFKLTYPNGDIRYFSGRVFSSLEGGFSANSMVSGTSNVGVSRAIVKIPAISFAANYITNTYSILGESKTFADAHNFTRSTTATFIGSNGLIQSAAIDAPRFTYDPVTLAPKGLLIEGARTNLLAYSEDFSQWITNGAPVVNVNTASAPDGASTADLLNTNQDTEGVYRSILTTAQNYTFSVFVKSAGANSTVKIGTDLFYVLFNCVTGNYTDSGNVTVSVEEYPSGWYRVAVTHSQSAGTFGYIVYGSGSQSDFYAWGAQLEAGSFASSYIPTTTAQVTRTPDACTAKEFTSWYNQGEGSVFVDANGKQNSFSINSDVFNRLTLYTNFSGGLDFLCEISDVGYTAVASYSDKASVSYTSDSIKLSSTDGFDSEVIPSLPPVDNLAVGASAGGSYLNGTIAELNYYPTALSDEVLQDLTR